MTQPKFFLKLSWDVLMVKIDLSWDVLKRDPYPDDSIILRENAS